MQTVISMLLCLATSCLFWRNVFAYQAYKREHRLFNMVENPTIVKRLLAACYVNGTVFLISLFWFLTR